MLMIFLDLLQSFLMMIEFKFDPNYLKHGSECFQTVPDVTIN